jgi:adenosylhomocysteine nucleosidase
VRGGLLLVVVGLRREAALLPRGVLALCSGGDPRRAAALLRGREWPGVQAVLSFGIAGGLDPALAPGDLVVATAVRGVGGSTYRADEAWALALTRACPGARLGMLAGSHAVVADPEAKRRLHEATGALAVDLESEPAAAFAAGHGLPFAALRAVADAAAETVPQAALHGLKADGRADPFAVTLGLLRRPAELPALLKLTARSRAALHALAQAATSLGGKWGPPVARLGLLAVLLGQGLLHLA